MIVPKAVILDLLPVYLAGDASPETGALVQEFLEQDPALAARIREQWAQALGAAPSASIPKDLELRSLRHAHGMIWLQILLFGLMVAFLAVFFGQKFAFAAGGLRVVPGHSFVMWLSFMLGIDCGLGFLAVRLWMRGVFVRRPAAASRY